MIVTHVDIAQATVGALVDAITHGTEIVATPCNGPECRAFAGLLARHHATLHDDNATREQITRTRTDLRLVAAAVDIIHGIDTRESLAPNFVMDVLDGLIEDLDHEGLINGLVEQWAPPEEEA